MKSEGLVETVRAYAEKYSLSLEAPYLVAVSGGRDSVVLLHSLVEAGFTQLVVGHLNHGLRGEQSDEDEAFVKDLAESLGCAYYSKKVDLSEASGGLELVARNARYSFFAEFTLQYGAEGVFLGHHAGDQAETILFNLLRGSANLQGMDESSSRVVDDVELQLLRPLLKVSREWVDQVVDQNNLDYREDATNADPITARNRIRHELLPLANDIMGREVAPILCRSEDGAKLDQAFIQSQWKLETFLDPQGRLFLPALLDADVCIQRRVLKSYLESAGVGQLSSELIARAQTLLTDEAVAKINLPGGLYLRRKEKRVFVAE